MKKALAIIILLTFCFALTVCCIAAGESWDAAPDTEENADMDYSPNIPENVLKAVYRDEDLNEVILYQNDDESYGMVIILYRLTEIEGDAAIDGDGFVLTGTDAAGQPVTLIFFPDTDSYTLEVTESTLEYLPVGEVFGGFMPVLKYDP